MKLYIERTAKGFSVFDEEGLILRTLFTHAEAQAWCDELVPRRSQR